jgi:hypothetical protein
MAVPTIRPPKTRAVVDGRLITFRIDILNSTLFLVASRSTKAITRTIEVTTAYVMGRKMNEISIRAMSVASAITERSFTLSPQLLDLLRDVFYITIGGDD